MLLGTLPVYAQSNDARVAELTAQINSLLATIRSLQQSLVVITGGQVSTNTNTNSSVTEIDPTSCEYVTTWLYKGVSDAKTQGQVSVLQRFLRAQGDYTDDITGYFGPATEAALKGWQGRMGLVYEGTPNTTGFGATGPQTRAKINELGCGGNTVVTTPVSCTLSTDKNSYTLGEIITYSWTSQNASYASFEQDTSGKDGLLLPGDKLPANGFVTVVANVIGNPSARLFVDGSFGVASCNKTVNVTSDLPVASNGVYINPVITNMQKYDGNPVTRFTLKLNKIKELPAGSILRAEFSCPAGVYAAAGQKGCGYLEPLTGDTDFALETNFPDPVYVPLKVWIISGTGETLQTVNTLGVTVQYRQISTTPVIKSRQVNIYSTSTASVVYDSTLQKEMAKAVFNLKFQNNGSGSESITSRALYPHIFNQTRNISLPPGNSGIYNNTFPAIMLDAGQSKSVTFEVSMPVLEMLSGQYVFSIIQGTFQLESKGYDGTEPVSLNILGQTETNPITVTGEKSPYITKVYTQNNDTELVIEGERLVGATLMYDRARYSPGISTASKLVFTNPFYGGSFNVQLDSAYGKSNKINIVVTTTSYNAAKSPVITQAYTRTNGKEIVIEGDNLKDSILLWQGKSFSPGVSTNTKLVFTNYIDQGAQTIQISSVYGKSNMYDIYIESNYQISAYPAVTKVYERAEGRELVIEGRNLNGAWLVLTDNTGNATDRYQPGIVSDTQLVFSNPFKEIGYYHIYLNAAHGRSEITRVNIVLGYPSVSKNALQIRKVYTRTNGKELIIEGDNIADAWLLYGGNSYYPGVRTNTQLIFTNPLSDGYQTVQLNSAYGRSQEFNILISNKEVKPLVVHIQDFPSSEINLGDTINLTADMGGGTGQYRVVWSLNNPGVHKFGFESNSYKTDTTHNIPNITLQKLGTYSISATVTDTNGNTATDVKSIKVTDSSSVNNTGAIANALQGVLDRLRQLLAEPITP